MGGGYLLFHLEQEATKPYLEASLEVTCTKAVCPGIVVGVRGSFQTNFSFIHTMYPSMSYIPTKLMDIRLFVEVIAVLTDVVQLTMKMKN